MLRQRVGQAVEGLHRPHFCSSPRGVELCGLCPWEGAAQGLHHDLRGVLAKPSNPRNPTICSRSSIGGSREPPDASGERGGQRHGGCQLRVMPADGRGSLLRTAATSSRMMKSPASYGPGSARRCRPERPPLPQVGANRIGEVPKCSGPLPPRARLSPATRGAHKYAFYLQWSWFALKGT